MQKIKRTGNPLSKRFPALHSVPVGAEQASTGRLAPLPRVDATGFEPAASASRTFRYHWQATSFKGSKKLLIPYFTSFAASIIQTGAILTKLNRIHFGVT